MQNSTPKELFEVTKFLKNNPTLIITSESVDKKFYYTQQKVKYINHVVANVFHYFTLETKCLQPN
jgi:hypothetical protein